VKVIPLEVAKLQLGAICEEALLGGIIRVKVASGGEVELTPVPKQVAPALSSQQLSDCYADSDWAEFENNCGKASE
jgi:hypothetical protein